jgi:hypothetical protein
LKRWRFRAFWKALLHASRLPDMLPLVQANLALFQKILLLEQEQRCSIVEAIERGHGARAEYLLREHSGIAARQLSPEARA